MSKTIIEDFYKRQAKDLTAVLFDKRFLNDDLSLISIEWLEDYLGFIIQSAANSAAKCAVLSASMRDKK